VVHRCADGPDSLPYAIGMRKFTVTTRRDAGECASRDSQTPEGQPTGAARNSSFSETGKKREPPRGTETTVVRRKTRNGSSAL
jgi:hypothetical protein